jgi:hypothetical protein
MNQPYSSQRARLSKQGYRIALGVGLLALMLVSSAFSFAPSAYTTVSGSTTLTSLKTPVNQTLDQSIDKAPKVQIETLMLPTTPCSALQKAHPGASCQLVSYTTVTLRPALSQGKLTATVPATWYNWSSSSWVCAVVGCWYWGLHLQGNGVLNYGSSIWQYNVFCNAQGLANCTWHGYFGNGTSTIQIGLDGNACIAYCASHGIRKSINDTGAQVSYYTW